MRICLVTPFDWSQPHDVNEHVAGVAAELRALGHEVTVLAPSSRARDLLESRRALDAGTAREVVAIGPAVPVSRRSRVGMPLGARTTLELALAGGDFEVVHGFEPGMPSLSYLALRDGKALAVASFLSARRLGYPPGKAQRERLLGRVDALVAASDRVAAAAAVRFPGDYEIVPVGVDPELFRPEEKERLIVVEWAPPERQLVKAAIRTLRELPDWRMLVLRTRPLAGRPYVPRELASRVSVRTLRGGEARAPVMARAAIFVPAAFGRERLRLEAAAAGAAIADPDGVETQPELAAAAMARLAEDDAYRARRAEAAARRGRGGLLPRGGRAPRRALRRPRHASARRAPRRRPARRPALDPRRPPHAHPLVARLLDRGPGAARPRRGRRDSARSPSPTTTSSAARSRRSSSPAAAT